MNLQVFNSSSTNQPLNLSILFLQIYLIFLHHILYQFISYLIQQISSYSSSFSFSSPNLHLLLFPSIHLHLLLYPYLSEKWIQSLLYQLFIRLFLLLLVVHFLLFSILFLDFNSIFIFHLHLYYSLFHPSISFFIQLFFPFHLILIFHNP